MNSRHATNHMRIQSSITYTKLGGEVSLEGRMTEYPSFESYRYYQGDACTLATRRQTHVMGLQAKFTDLSGRC